MPVLNHTVNYCYRNSRNYQLFVTFPLVEIGAFYSVPNTVLKPVNLIVAATPFMPVLNPTINYCYRNSRNYQLFVTFPLEKFGARTPSFSPTLKTVIIM